MSLTGRKNTNPTGEDLVSALCVCVCARNSFLAAPSTAMSVRSFIMMLSGNMRAFGVHVLFFNQLELIC